MWKQTQDYVRSHPLTDKTPIDVVRLRLVTTGVALVAIGAAWLWNVKGVDFVEFKDDAWRLLRRAD